MPLQTALDWFPDRRGLAGGIVVAGFGSGALVFTPAMAALSSHYCSLPTLLGPAASADIITEAGRQFARVGGELKVQRPPDTAPAPWPCVCRRWCTPALLTSPSCPTPAWPRAGTWWAPAARAWPRRW